MGRRLPAGAFARGVRGAVCSVCASSASILFQLHRVRSAAFRSTNQVGALAALRTEGKIRHIGLSNVSAAHQLNASQRKIVEIVSVQNRYNVADRDSDDVVAACEAAGIAFIPYFPIDAGDLAQKSGRIGRIADVHAATPAQIALAWLLKRSAVMLPIPGTSSQAHFDENLAAENVALSDAEFEQLAA